MAISRTVWFISLRCSYSSSTASLFWPRDDRISWIGFYFLLSFIIQSESNWVWLNHCHFGPRVLDLTQCYTKIIIYVYIFRFRAYKARPNTSVASRWWSPSHKTIFIIDNRTIPKPNLLIFCNKKKYWEIWMGLNRE